MQIVKGLNAIPAGRQPRVLTIGSFDGVHLGHRSLIGQVVAAAQKVGARSAVLSFDPHPAEVLRPEIKLARLFSVEDMAAQLGAIGVDDLILEPFTLALAQLSAREFVQKILASIDLKVLFVGYDFAFGKDRQGGYAELKKMGVEFGFDVQQVEPAKFDGQVISSSRIRKLIEVGDVTSAQKLLGRAYYLEGQVVSGDGRGRALGFATANLKCQTVLKPLPGVYITKFQLMGGRVENANLGLDSPMQVSVTNIGFKPTFYENHELTIETHVLDAEQNFVGKKVRVELLQRLRDELKFESAHELIKQIESDVRQTRKFFRQ